MAGVESKHCWPSLRVRNSAHPCLRPRSGWATGREVRVRVGLAALRVAGDPLAGIGSGPHWSEAWRGGQPPRFKLDSALRPGSGPGSGPLYRDRIRTHPDSYLADVPGPGAPIRTHHDPTCCSPVAALLQPCCSPVAALLRPYCTHHDPTEVKHRFTPIRNDSLILHAMSYTPRRAHRLGCAPIHARSTRAASDRRMPSFQHPPRPPRAPTGAKGRSYRAMARGRLRAVTTEGRRAVKRV